MTPHGVRAGGEAVTVDGRRLVLACLLVALVATVAAAPGTWVRATFGAHTTADEPHYLLTALSLAEDGDLDVADELEDERYRAFHELSLPEQAAPRPDGRRIVPHDPLLPLLLAVPMGLGGWVAAKLTLAALAGILAAATSWVAVRRFGVGIVPASVTVALAAASVPLANYGTQVYPEVPAALATVLALGAAAGAPRVRTAATLVLAITALPWLAVKYVPVAAVLAAVALWRWWRAGATRLVLTAVAGFVVAGAGYVVGHLAWYGGLTVYAAGGFFQEHGGQLTVVGLAPDYLGRARRLVGLLVDRDFGIGTWQPLWFLAVPAFAALVRRRPAGWDLVVLPTLAGWLTATFLALTMQGWWFPGRQVVVVLPLVVIALAWLADRGRGWTVAVAGAGVAGVVNHAFLTVQGLRGELRWIIDFATTSSPAYRLLRPALPDYLTVTWRTWVLQTVWVVALAALGWLGWWSAGARREPSGGTAPGGT